MSALKEKSVGMMIYGGCGSSLLCGCGTWILMVGLGVSGLRTGAQSGAANFLMYLAIFVTVVAGLVGVVGIGMGILSSNSEFSGERLVAKNARVIARYAIDDEGVMMTDDFSVANMEKPKYFVRLDIGSGENAEYQCAEKTYWEAGEGMLGDAEIQGKWLGQFTPYFGVDQGIQDDRISRL
jgi:hypothetical protein